MERFLETLDLEPPFVWPEPRVLEGICAYKHQPPFRELALTSNSLFGIASSITSRGVEVLRSWLVSNVDLKARLIIAPYPTSPTSSDGLSELRDLAASSTDRLAIHVRPLDKITDRATNALCFLAATSGGAHLVVGASEDFGNEAPQAGRINLVFRASAPLVESFKCSFNWLWANSAEIAAKGVAVIPSLVVPEGTEEGARLWRQYKSDCSAVRDFGESTSAPKIIARVDPESGDVTMQTQTGQEIPTPTEELSLKKLDQLAESVARIYEKGSLVSIDKLSRIPPLDAPLDPSLFGDEAELQRGSVTRKISMRVSIIDEKTLKGINKRRQSLRALLNRFTFGLADNIRWMPAAGRNLFESEVKRVDEEGSKLIGDLLKGGVDEFIKDKRGALTKDINDMYKQLGRSGQVTDKVIDRVVQTFKDRLTKAHTSTFLPTLSYSELSFTSRENAYSSPWGQAFSLLADITAFPRKALTSSFFF